MNPKDKHPDSRLATLAELIFVGVLVIIAFQIFGDGWERLVAVNVGAVFLVFRLVRSAMKRELARKLGGVADAVRVMGDDFNAEISAADAPPDMARFYAELERLRAGLARRESDRQDMMRVLNTIATNIELEKMLEDIMPQVVAATRSLCSAFYLINPITGMLEIKHSIGFSKNIYGEFDLSLSEGLMGQAAKSREIRVLRDVPQDTAYMVRTFLGTLKPKNIMAVPVLNQEQMLGVLMLASVYDYTQDQIDGMGLTRYYLGVAVHNGVNYEKNKRLTNELKFQNKLIQDLNADLEHKVLDRTMFLNDVIDSIKDYAIYALDTNGVIVAWNTGAENLLGFKAADVMNNHVEVIYADDPDRVNSVKRRIDSALRDGRYVESGWRQRPGGGKYHLEMTLFARYSQTGEVAGFTNVTRDMTAYKKSAAELGAEKEFSARLIEAVPHALMLLDASGAVKLSNAAAREIFDNSGAHGFFGYCRNDGDVRKRMNALLESGEESDEFEATIKSGARVTLNVSLVKDRSSMIKLLLVRAELVRLGIASASG